MCAKIQNMLDKSSLPKPGEIIVLDTSVVLGFTKQSREYSNDFNLCSTFIQNTLANNNIVGITAKTFEELHLIAEARNFPKDKRDIVNINSNITQSHQLAQHIYLTLKKLNNFYPDFIGGQMPYGELISQSIQNRRTHSMRLADSQIYTQAVYDGAFTICTLDKDWQTIKDNNVTILMQPKHLSNSTMQINRTS